MYSTGWIVKSANASLDSFVFCCLPDPIVFTTEVVLQGASGICWDFGPLADVSAVQTYLRCRVSRCPAPPALEQSWDRFYRRYQPFVRWVIAKSCRPVERDDISQEIWTEIIVELPRLTDGSIQGDFSSWLAGLTRRKIGRVVHQQGTCWKLGQLSIEIENAPLASSDLGPDEECLFKEMLEQLEAALTKLRNQTSQKNCELFCRKFFGNQSAQKIAAALSLTTNEVECRYHRMKRKWRTLTKGTIMDQYGEEDVKIGKHPPSAEEGSLNYF
jgi:RNA polymerase sigma factor (sigma-70 family)